MTRVVLLDLLVERPAFGQGGNAEIMAPFAPAECLLLTPQLDNREAWLAMYEVVGSADRSTALREELAFLRNHQNDEPASSACEPPTPGMAIV